MPRIAMLELNQVNNQLDRLDTLYNQVQSMSKLLNNVGHSISIADPIHAVTTTNNLAFTWTGATTKLSWTAGWIKDKNWNAQTTTAPFKSSAPGFQHIFAVPAGNLTLTASTYYWVAWDPDHQAMRATSDASLLHGDKDVLIVCQLFTGTAGQTGAAGGGGSTGGTDLSGSRYKNF